MSTIYTSSIEAFAKLRELKAQGKIVTIAVLPDKTYKVIEIEVPKKPEPK
jgi:hypothetical protein